MCVLRLLLVGVECCAQQAHQVCSLTQNMTDHVLTSVADSTQMFCQAVRA